MSSKRVLALGKQSLSCTALVSPISELRTRGYVVDVFSAGNEAEARGFKGLDYTVVSPNVDLSKLVPNYDLVITGSDFHLGPEGRLTLAANANGTPVVRVMTRNDNYQERFGTLEGLPSIIAVMNEGCIETLSEMPGALGKTARERARVVGWTAFDHFARVRDEYTLEKREALLASLREAGYEIPDTVHTYFSQNVQTGDRSFLPYELTTTELLFGAAADLGLTLVVKPHPREVESLTRSLADKFGFTYLPADACNTLDLIFASDAILAGRSTVLTEGCLSDRNTGGILPGSSEIQQFPALATGAIPYAGNIGEIPVVISKVTSDDPKQKADLKELRKKFSVDGNAGKRLVDIIEASFF